MAKNKMAPQKDKVATPWSDFKPMKSGEYRILYSKQTNRASLYANDGNDFRFSDQNLSSIFKDAEIRYGIKYEDWRAIIE